MIREKEKFLSFERRKFPRLNETAFVLYRLKSDASDEFNKAFTENISGGGLMFEMENHMPLGAKLELEMYQPIKRSKTMIFSIATLAEIIWIKDIEKNNFEKGENKYQIGVEFLKIDEKERQKIVKYVKR